MADLKIPGSSLSGISMVGSLDFLGIHEREIKEALNTVEEISELSSIQNDELDRLIQSNEYIKAVKLLRELSKKSDGSYAGLVEAKQEVDRRAILLTIS